MHSFWSLCRYPFKLYYILNFTCLCTWLHVIPCGRGSGSPCLGHMCHSFRLLWSASRAYILWLWLLGGWLLLRIGIILLVCRLIYLYVSLRCLLCNWLLLLLCVRHVLFYCSCKDITKILLFIKAYGKFMRFFK